MGVARVSIAAIVVDFSSRNKSLLAILMVSCLIVDTMLSNLSDIFKQLLISITGKYIFLLLNILIYTSGLLLFLGYTQKVSHVLVSKSRSMYYMFYSMIVIFFSIFSLVLVISLEIIIFSEYHIYLLVAVTSLGYTMASVVMAVMAYYMIQWYRRDRRNLMLLLFVLSSSITALACFNVGFSQNGLLLQTNLITVNPNSEVKYPTLNPVSSQILGDLYSISLIQAMFAYGLTWGAVALLLYNYSKRIGFKKYLLIISLPMAAFLIGITPILLQLPVTSSYFDPAVLFFRILSISALLAVAILYGVAFLTAIKAIKQYTKSNVVEYLLISAFGISSLFISLAANIAHGAYPPFGTATYGFISIASYFFLLGIYSSAVKVSVDSDLRKTIKRSIEEQTKFLDSIGLAEIQHQVEQNVTKISKEYSEELKSKSGIEPDVSYDEMLLYAKEVMLELNKNKNKLSK